MFAEKSNKSVEASLKTDFCALVRHRPACALGSMNVVRTMSCPNEVLHDKGEDAMGNYEAGQDSEHIGDLSVLDIP